MPKIKDLGIKVIPETMQPPEVGGGAGCPVACSVSPAAVARPCNPTFGCTDCTNQAFSICGTTPQGCLHTFQQCRPTYCGVTVGCTAPFSLCGPISPRCGVSIDPS